VANPQLSNGYTKIANELLEAICRLNVSGNEMRILLYIIRRTYGFNRTYAEIPLSDISEALGMKKGNVSRELKKLREANIIEQHSNKGVRPQTLSIVKNYEKWCVESCAVLPLSNSITVIKTDNPTVINSDNPTYKEKKENIKERVKEKPHGRYGNVLLTDNQYSDLTKDYGENNVRDYIQRVDSHVQSTGKAYADYDATIRKWLTQDGVKKDDFDADKYSFAINNF
jgi:phage replication O-like protein O